MTAVLSMPNMYFRYDIILLKILNSYHNDVTRLLCFHLRPYPTYRPKRLNYSY